MAEIVLGIGTSHSPLLNFGADMWAERGADDRRNQALTLSDGRTLSYDALLAERGPVRAEESGERHLRDQVRRCEAALTRLADAIEAVAPDLLLVVGDDQEELFKPENTPSIALFCGPEIVMRPLGELIEAPPDWMRQALTGYAMDAAHRFPAAADFALKLADRLMDQGVDLGVYSTIDDPGRAAFGHAFGFIAQRMLKGRRIPMMPLLLNTYYPPNVIRPGRCYDIGRMITQAVGEIAGRQRIAVIASGGLSHFVTDPDLDLGFLDALRNGDEHALRALPMRALRAGSSEILCWVLAGGAFSHLRHSWSDYVPVYRTPAGTGIGLAFGIWGERQASGADGTETARTMVEAL